MTKKPASCLTPRKTTQFLYFFRAYCQYLHEFVIISCMRKPAKFGIVMTCPFGTHTHKLNLIYMEGGEKNV